jgi:hypothetical protein
VFRTAPFEGFELIRGKQLGGSLIFGSAAKKVGLLKGIVRLVNSKDEPSTLNMTELLNPKTHIVRVYVLEGKQLLPRGR